MKNLSLILLQQGAAMGECIIISYVLCTARYIKWVGKGEKIKMF